MLLKFRSSDLAQFFSDLDFVRKNPSGCRMDSNSSIGLEA